MKKKSKNIVICLDGTGNQIEKNLSNVLKLYRTLDKDEEQLVFYDQGVGTLGHVYTWGKKYQQFKNLLGLAFGLGLDKNVLEAYEFIIENYAEFKDPKTREVIRDNIYIFGFSRGAYTARVLAGLLYEVGLLSPSQKHLSGAALTAYKQSHADAESADINDEGAAANFRRIAGTKIVSISFLGVWDTVSSVLIPSYRGYFPPLVFEKLPHTNRNPAVRCFRHAMAIDERRRMFAVDRWEPDQEFRPAPFISNDDRQDALEMWFCGYHSDVGGGNERTSSGISQFSLIWMIGEAQKHGLKISKRMADYVTGQKKWSATTRYTYPEPSILAKIHNSMKAAWFFPLEIIPKRVHPKMSPHRKSLFGFYIPLGEPRVIGEDDALHSSVKERIEKVPDYDPINMP